MREHLPHANVLREHHLRLVPGLAHDVALVHSVHRSLRHATGAKTVASEWFRFYAGALRGGFENRPDRILVQRTRRDATVTIDRPEQRTRGNASLLQPPSQSTNRASLSVVPDRDADFADIALIVRSSSGPCLNSTSRVGISQTNPGAPFEAQKNQIHSGSVLSLLLTERVSASAANSRLRIYTLSGPIDDRRTQSIYSKAKFSRPIRTDL